MEKIKDQSFGVIPVRRSNGQWQVFLIHQYSGIGDNNYWILPKGHSEGEESGTETALRELKEETGLVPEELITDKTFELNYRFRYEDKLILKKVIFFIGYITDSNYTLDQREVRDAGWFGLEEAVDRLDYEDTKKAFREASAFITDELPNLL